MMKNRKNGNQLKLGMLLLSIVIAMSMIAESSIDNQKNSLNLSIGGDLYGKNQDNVTIYINITNPDNITKLWVDFIYNESILNLVDVNAGDVVLSDFTTKIKDGDLRIEIGPPNDHLKNLRISGNGTIAIINFTVIGANESSSYLNIKLKDIRNKDNQIINVNIENSTFLVNNSGEEKGNNHRHDKEEHEKDRDDEKDKHEHEHGAEHEHEKEGHEKDKEPVVTETLTELPTSTPTSIPTPNVTETTPTETNSPTPNVTEIIPTPNITETTPTETIFPTPNVTETIPVPTEIIPEPTPIETIPAPIKIVGVSGGEGFDNSKIIGEPDIFEEEMGDLKASIPAVYSFNIYDFSIYEIVTLDKQNENKIYIRVTKIKDTIKFTNDTPEIVYTNESITSDSQRLSNILIRLKVNNSWVDNNGISGRDVHLYKLVNGSWTLLDTVLKSRDEKYTYLEANDTNINRWQLFTISGAKNSTNVSVDKESKVGSISIPSNNVTVVKPRNSIPWSGIVLVIAFLFAYSYYLIKKRKD